MLRIFFTDKNDDFDYFWYEPAEILIIKNNLPTKRKLQIIKAIMDTVELQKEKTAV